jgi:hypothetical protein
VSTIAVLTDPEDRLAAQTNSLTENHSAMPGHCEPQARLDNGAGSWHLGEAVSDGDLRCCQRDPAPSRARAKARPLTFPRDPRHGQVWR